MVNAAVTFVNGTRINLYFPASLQKARRAVVLFYGLPRHYPLDYSNPAVRNFLSKNFLVLCPEYPGTFGSSGRFSTANALKSALASVQLAAKGSAVDAWSRRKLRWKVRAVVLCGASFGGAVALVAGAKSPLVTKIVSLCPVTHFGEHARLREEKDSFAVLRGQVERAFPHLWRLDGKAWKKMEAGRVDLNAVDYVKQLAAKNILLIHGGADEVVSVRRSKDLLARLKRAHGKGKRRLIVLPKEGHVGIGLLGSARIFKQVLKFLSQK